MASSVCFFSIRSPVRYKSPMAMHKWQRTLKSIGAEVVCLRNSARNIGSALIDVSDGNRQIARMAVSRRLGSLEANSLSHWSNDLPEYFATSAAVGPFEVSFP